MGLGLVTHDTKNIEVLSWAFVHRHKAENSEHKVSTLREVTCVDCEPVFYGMPSMLLWHRWVVVYDVEIKGCHSV